MEEEGSVHSGTAEILRPEGAARGVGQWQEAGPTLQQSLGVWLQGHRNPPGSAVAEA